MAIVRRVFFFFMVNLLVMGSIMAVYTALQFFFPEVFSQYFSNIFFFAALLGFGGSFISLLISKFMAKKVMGVQVIPENTTDSNLRWVLETTHRLSRQAGLKKMPEVGVYNGQELNAFATGPSKNNALVAVSVGLLNSMDKDEVEGVLGHEVAHVANGDMVTMALVQGIVNSIVIVVAHVVTQIIDNALRNDNGRGGLGGFAGFMVYNLIYNLIAFLAYPLVAYISRWREFRADQGGAQLAGREKMISGLRSLQKHVDEINTEHKSLATMKISNKPGFLNLWSTHPPLEKRIQRLQMGN